MDLSHPNASNVNEYLKACGKGDLKQVELLFGNLTRQVIESIRDDHKARYISC